MCVYLYIYIFQYDRAPHFKKPFSACDNARINVWKIPPEGLPVGPSQDKPEFYLRGIL